MTKDKAQQVISALQKVCKEHGVFLYGVNEGEEMLGEILISENPDFRNVTDHYHDNANKPQEGYYFEGWYVTAIKPEG
jgi:hypothetical protein